ncbi:hypothetical protein J8273_6554 [Carpediemonas membranifera]|uniref:Uncharacterized protein n=1 Tax=Carpediemonas membranifera TaxID=201153 RepID=A0A8J6AT70_9EUKA|nr:hypothetical protein J8273_6554 [Carpediemonas membranifera]|eukprot:KAG9391775.1 hypothetical protein J8273_6554 [Carpediemonas membranifera]
MSERVSDSAHDRSPRQHIRQPRLKHHTATPATPGERSGYETGLSSMAEESLHASHTRTVTNLHSAQLLSSKIHPLSAQSMEAQPPRFYAEPIQSEAPSGYASDMSSAAIPALPEVEEEEGPSSGRIRRHLMRELMDGEGFADAESISD